MASASSIAALALTIGVHLYIAAFSRMHESYREMWLEESIRDLDAWNTAIGSTSCFRSSSAKEIALREIELLRGFGPVIRIDRTTCLYASASKNRSYTSCIADVTYNSDRRLVFYSYSYGFQPGCDGQTTEALSSYAANELRSEESTRVK